MKRPYQIDPRPSQDFVWLSASMSVEQILDQLRVMHRMETTTYTRCDYLYREGSPYYNTPVDIDPELGPVSFSSSYCHPVINELTRQNMIDLLYEIGDYCNFRRETVQYAIWNLMDRYLALPSHKPLHAKADFQLIASTALYIAVKLLEPVSMDVQSLADLSRGAFGASDLLQMERDMITALEWNISHGPTPIGYVQLYLTLLLPTSNDNNNKEVWYNLWEQAQYQVELSVVNYKLVTQRHPSEIALAAVWNATETQLDTTVARQWQLQLSDLLQSIGLCTDKNLSYIQLQLCKLQYQADAQMQERENQAHAKAQAALSSSHPTLPLLTTSALPDEDDDDDYDYSDEETERSGERTTPCLFPSPISVAVDLLSASQDPGSHKKKTPNDAHPREGIISYLKSFFS